MKLGETTVFFAVGTKEIIPRISEAHAVFDCNTVAPYHGAAKDDIAKKTQNGKSATILKACIDEDVNETANLIRDCYGFEKHNIIDCRIEYRMKNYQKLENFLWWQVCIRL